MQGVHSAEEIGLCPGGMGIHGRGRSVEGKSRNIPGKDHEVWIGQGRGWRAGRGIRGAETTELDVCWGRERGRTPDCSLAFQLGEASVSRVETGAGEMALAQTNPVLLCLKDMLQAPLKTLEGALG